MTTSDGGSGYSSSTEMSPESDATGENVGQSEASSYSWSYDNSIGTENLQSSTSETQVGEAAADSPMADPSSDEPAKGEAAQNQTPENANTSNPDGTESYTPPGGEPNDAPQAEPASGEVQNMTPENANTSNPDGTESYTPPPGGEPTDAPQAEPASGEVQNQTPENANTSNPDGTESYTPPPGGEPADAPQTEPGNGEAAENISEKEPNISRPDGREDYEPPPAVAPQTERDKDHDWHKDRNIHNQKPVGELKHVSGNKYVDEAGREWYRQPDSKNVFHQPKEGDPNYDPTDPKPNTKYTSPDSRGGSSEVIVQRDGTYLETGPLQGTYNYADADTSPVEHIFKDILPHRFDDYYNSTDSDLYEGGMSGDYGPDTGPNSTDPDDMASGKTNSK